MPIFRLSDRLSFPPPQLASDEGLLAVGGDLSTQRLLLAYSMGIFPWFSEDDPVLWWSPDPRLVLYPEEINVSRSLRKVIRKEIFTITLDQDFSGVINACAHIRVDEGEDTWITEPMKAAYQKLHDQGFAHSVEAWHDGALVGGLYGVALGRCFFGESMFSEKSNASKVAFVTLVRYLQQKQYALIDCQVKTDHLISLGAREISRYSFLAQLRQSLLYKTDQGKWHFSP